MWKIKNLYGDSHDKGEAGKSREGRIKEPDSLIVKIVNKIYEGKEIYTDRLIFSQSNKEQCTFIMYAVFVVNKEQKWYNQIIEFET